MIRPKVLVGKGGINITLQESSELWPRPKQPENLPPLVLAYLGDAVYEVYVRQALVARGFTRVKTLHREATHLVQASSQARFIHAIEGLLTPEEQQILRRGRNAKSGRVPRSADVVAYRWSTGLESLIGYLHLEGRFDRIAEILAHLPWPSPDQRAESIKQE